MVQTKNETPVQGEEVRIEGFRLQHLEVYNWGTFNQRIWILNAAGGSSLLTGANGSGKSTLVDALLTLLVPPQKRTYNLASGSEKRRERDERTYIQGAWGKQKDLENNRSKPQYLRANDTHSVLLAVFENATLQQTLTLAQVLWLDENAPQRLFFVALRPLSIDEHFRLRGSPKELRKQVKAQDIEVYDQFAKYSQRFRQFFALRSEKALDLFNQIVSMKEIGSLNTFVREHMLEKTDAQERIRQLRENFENLTRAHDSIQLAGRQLAILEPLMQDTQKYADLQARIQAANRCSELVPAYIAWRKMTLLEEALTISQQQLATAETRSQTLQRLLENLNQSIVDLRVAIDKDTVGRRLEQLKSEIKQVKQRYDDQKNQATHYDQLAKQLGLPVYEDEATFYATRQQAIPLQQSIRERQVQLRGERDQHMQQMVKLKDESTLLEKELLSLRNRTSQIPSEDILLRGRIAAALHLTEEDLPFVGELLRVRQSEQRWEPAIERLLRGFGLRLLVADKYYPEVSRYVDRTHLGRRLVYLRVQVPRVPLHNERLDANALYHKLEVKPDTPFTQWLDAELLDAHNYLCCETLEEFQYVHLALTINGQIKRGQVQHEKDDSAELGNRRRYVLGWNNKEKQEALRLDLEAYKKSLQSLNEHIQQVEQQQDIIQKQADALQRLLEFESFTLLDWRTSASQLQDLRAQFQELQMSSSHLATLTEQLHEAERQRKMHQDERDLVTSEVTTLKRDIEAYSRESNECRYQFDEATLAQEVLLLGQMQKDLKTLERERGSELSLITVNDLRDRLRQFYYNRASSFQGQANQQVQLIVNGMRTFLQTNPSLEQEMDASIDALAEYQRVYERVQREDLPRYQRSFKALLNEKVVTDIGSFQAALKQQEEDIRDSIRHLNGPLSSIGYTDSTYIRLNCESTHDADIREFRNLLKDCLPDVGRDEHTSEANEASFQHIRALLQRFEEQSNWTQKVTNVRNWLDFSASELYREDNSQKRYHSDSSGQSGGQKVKLAYTILASAIAYQYGLDQVETRRRTFRFVAIDEAFGRSDERNAQYAMRLFRQLDLQVLIVTPLDKIQIAEPYIASCHLVTNNEEENDSKVYNLTRAEYLERKRAWRMQDAQ